MLKDIYTNNIQPETTEETSEELNNNCSITESEEGDIIFNFKMDISSIPTRPRHARTQTSSTIYINNEMKESRPENIFSHVDRHLMSIIVEAGRCLTYSEFDSICDKTLTFNLSKALPKVFGGMSLAQIKSNVKIYNEIMNKMNLDMCSYPVSATNLIKNFTINVEIDDIPFNILMVLDAPINHRLIMYYALLMKEYSFSILTTDTSSRFANTISGRKGIVSTADIFKRLDTIIKLHNKVGISTLFAEPKIIKYLVDKWGIVINDYPEEYRDDIILLGEACILRDLANSDITCLFLMTTNVMKMNTLMVNNDNDNEIVVNIGIRDSHGSINKIRIPISYMIDNTITNDSLIISHMKSLLDPQIYCKVSSRLYGYINDKNEFIACNDDDKITHVILTYYSNSCLFVDVNNQDKTECIISRVYESDMTDEEMSYLSMIIYKL